MSDYTHLNFVELQNLPYSEYKKYYHDAWISNLQQTDNGREFLETCWRIQQTEADEAAIKKYKEGG